jgi:hypothetical protein
LQEERLRGEVVGAVCGSVVLESVDFGSQVEANAFYFIGFPQPYRFKELIETVARWTASTGKPPLLFCLQCCVILVEKVSPVPPFCHFAIIAILNGICGMWMG